MGISRLILLLASVIGISVGCILGMLPLLADAFFNSMAVTIMGGLAFASLLTLIAVPTLYAMLFHISSDEVDS